MCPGIACRRCLLSRKSADLQRPCVTFQGLALDANVTGSGEMDNFDYFCLRSDFGSLIRQSMFASGIVQVFSATRLYRS